MVHDKIPFLKHARYLVEDTVYSMLTYNTRNHGESGDGPLKVASYGSQNVEAAIEFIFNVINMLRDSVPGAGNVR